MTDWLVYYVTSKKEFKKKMGYNSAVLSFRVKQNWKTADSWNLVNLRF